jgi:hypothetical protein
MDMYHTRKLLLEKGDFTVVSFTPLKNDIHLNNMYKLNSYLTGNVMHFLYKNQQVNAVYRNRPCLL